MKPFRERIRPEDGASWALLNRRLEDEIPFQWHHHPEFELTLTLNSRGQRFIGDHIGSYDDGDLVLVGPNLPHTWASRDKVRPGAPHVALVMWFLPHWASPLGSLYVELRPVLQMLARASAGLAFSPAASAAARPLIERVFASTPEDRLLLLLQILLMLARDGDAATLSSPVLAAAPGADRSRIDRVLDHIHQHYAEGVSMETLADVAALSPSGLHRLFRRHTGETVSAYLMRLRIGEACALLSATTRPVARIAEDVGYASLANFNRQFRAHKGMTPRAYRQPFARGR